MQTPFLNNYALGIEVKRFNDEVKITHGGRTPGFTTNLTYLKSTRLKIVKFDNIDGGVVDRDAEGKVIELRHYQNGKISVLKKTNLVEFKFIQKAQKIETLHFLDKNKCITISESIQDMMRTLEHKISCN